MDDKNVYSYITYNYLPTAGVYGIVENEEPKVQQQNLRLRQN